MSTICCKLVIFWGWSSKEESGMEAGNRTAATAEDTWDIPQ